MAAQKQNPEKLFVRVHTRNGIIINEEVRSVSSVNDTGVFDVLREHAQFITKIKENIKVTKLDGTNVVIPVGDAIMRVKAELVEVFLGIKAA